MSGQVQSRDKSELARRAKSGGGLSKSGAIFPGQQGSFRWAGPALGASPAELRALGPGRKKPVALGDGGGGEGEASTWRSGEEEGRTVGERDQRVLEKAARPEDSAGAK